jgi:ssDNA-binding Zn-finger/Zn-ribbon topoisomerase 1
MSHDRQMIGACPKCSGSDLACAYNHFENNDLTIDSWEHRCPDCGFRETAAFRSDEEDAKIEDTNLHICPYCARSRS